jgi:hypothetical protein
VGLKVRFRLKGAKLEQEVRGLRLTEIGRPLREIIAESRLTLSTIQKSEKPQTLSVQADVDYALKKRIDLPRKEYGSSEEHISSGGRLSLFVEGR